MGGLGNQLFMIFAGISYALDHNIEYTILSHNDKTQNGTRTYWNTLLDRLNNKYSQLDRQIQWYNEPCFHHTNIPDSMQNSDFILHGYFQSYKYFDHNFEKIKDMLDLTKKIKDVYNRYCDLFIGKKTVAMHFRLGDYLGLQAYHYVQRPEYYIEALLQLQKDLQKRGENIGAYQILCFFEENDKAIIDKYISLIKELTKLECNFTYIPFEIADWEQILLMANCDHLIIANSTFSWWGAYFNTKADKLVYYPNKWFGPANVDKLTHDLCPTDWTVI